MPSPAAISRGVEDDAGRGEDFLACPGRAGDPERHGERALRRTRCAGAAVEQIRQELGILAGTQQDGDATLEQRRSRQHEREVVGQTEGRLGRAEDVRREPDAAIHSARRARPHGIQREAGIERIRAEALVEADEELRGWIGIGFRHRPAGELFLGRRGIALIAASAEMYSTTRPMFPISRLPRKFGVPQPYTSRINWVGSVKSVESRSQRTTCRTWATWKIDGSAGSCLNSNTPSSAPAGMAAGTIEPIAWMVSRLATRSKN